MPPSGDRGAEDPRAEARRAVSGFVLAYAVAAVLIIALIYFGDVWSILANTRVLRLLIDGGVVALHDGQLGWIQGVADPKNYLKAIEPIDWSLILVVIGIFWLFWAAKGVQFHLLCRSLSLPGSFGEHCRAYYRGLLYGNGLPGRVGDVAAAAALTRAGVPAERALFALRLSEALVVFEIVIFAILGLLMLGWGAWLLQLLCALAILAVAYWWSHPGPEQEERPLLSVVTEGLRELSSRPRRLVALVLLSVVAFGVEDVAAYIAAMAFSGEWVRLHASFDVILMGVVGSYIARYVRLTPGGIGQFEWGFAAALYFGGVGFPEAATIAILDNVLRYVAFAAFYPLAARRARPGDPGGVLAAFIDRHIVRAV